MRILIAVCLVSGCASVPYESPKPLTKAEVREQWKVIGCHLDAGANFDLCLSDDLKCCEIMGAK